jgi:hypothetical protein
LIISYEHRPGQSRSIAARLVDVTDRGLGVKIHTPFVAGSVVFVDGQFSHPDFGLEVHARARVVYCQALNSGLYRLGLFLEEVCYQSVCRQAPPAELAVAAHSSHWC